MTPSVAPAPAFEVLSALTASGETAFIVRYDADGAAMSARISGPLGQHPFTPAQIVALLADLLRPGWEAGSTALRPSFPIPEGMLRRRSFSRESSFTSLLPGRWHVELCTPVADTDAWDQAADMTPWLALHARWNLLYSTAAAHV